MINLLSSLSYQYLKNNMLPESDEFCDIPIYYHTFPDGEHYWRIEDAARIQGKPAAYICGTIDDAAIFEAYNICCTLVREGCSELHLIIPYFGYSTMERAVKEGEAVTAKNIARLFSSIPTSMQGNHLYMLELHSLGTQYYFEGNIHPIHLTAWSKIKDIITSIGSDCVLASTDMGRAKWIEKMGNQLHMDTAYIMKKRISGETTEVTALNAEVKGRNVIIFDDMIRSGSSIIHAAEAYKNAGADKIYVIAVHGVFTDGAIEKMQQSGLIEKVFCSNSHVRTQQINTPFVQIYDISNVITTALQPEK